MKRYVTQFVCGALFFSLTGMQQVRAQEKEGWNRCKPESMSLHGLHWPDMNVRTGSAMPSSVFGRIGDAV